jgi:hypothetical protein
LSAIEGRTFVHGSVQVEREGSKSCSRVPGGGETPFGRWVQGERNLPRVTSQWVGDADADSCGYRPPKFSKNFQLQIS